MRKKVAFLFPGQGSQSVGMGLEFFQEYDCAREVFSMADEIAGARVSQLCFNGPSEDLTLTENLQPAITAVNLAVLSVLEREWERPDIVAGHSLGEFSALFASRIISQEDCLRVVSERGRLMNREALERRGVMFSLVGLPMRTIQELVSFVRRRERGSVAVANYNTARQVVISGDPRSVERVSVLAVQRGAKSFRLNVSGAWHSPLMCGAEHDFRKLLASVPFHTPERPVVFNVTANCETEPHAIKKIMAGQMMNTVQWYDSILEMTNKKATVFVEVGPGKVLTGLLRKIIPATYPYEAYSMSSGSGLEKFLKAMET